MSITRKIGGTYYICMFMMNNNRWGKILGVPVVGDQSSGRGWFGRGTQSSLFPQAGCMDIFATLV